LEVLINSRTEVAHEIEIIVPYEELHPHFEKAYREEAKNISIPGFRRGRAPLQIIKKRFGTAIEYQVIEKLSNQFFRTALEERDISPLGQPQLNDLDYQPGRQLTIKVSYETAPGVLIRDYKGLQLERLRHTVTEEEIDDELMNIRKSRRTLEDAEIPDDEHYVVSIDIQILDEAGNPIPGRRNTDLRVEMDDDAMSSDLISELYNMRVGEEKDVEFTYDDESTERARVKVKSVQRMILPELNDEFAALVTGGAAPTVDELRSVIRKKHEEIWSKRYREWLEKELVSEILNRNPFDVPQVVVNGILDDAIESWKQRQPGKQFPDDFDEAEFRKQREHEAVWAVKWMYARDNIIEQEGIALEEADYEAKAEETAEFLNMDKEHIIEFYKTSSEHQLPLLIDKLFDFLFAASKIKDVDDNDISRVGTTPITLQEITAADAQVSEDDEYAAVTDRGGNPERENEEG